MALRFGCSRISTILPDRTPTVLSALRRPGVSAQCNRRQESTAAATARQPAIPIAEHTSSSAAPPLPLPEAECDNSLVGLTGGEIFHELMLRHGVKVVFGYPGGAILPVFDAIHESKHFKFILARHEQGAGHMAEGYARACGKPGVVLVTSGPGATNVITPMQDALSDGTPMVVFTGQVPTTAIGTDAFQEADIVGISRACTKWNTMVTCVEDLPRRINEAFHIATTGRLGPVLVDLPKDVTAGRLLKPIVTQAFIPTVAKRPDALEAERKATLAAIKRSAQLINRAQRPIIYAGQGVLSSGAEAELKELAERGNIPVTTTLMSLGIFDETSPLSLHMLGMHGSVYANYSMQEADVIIALGARFDDRITGNLKRFAPAARRAEREGRGGIVHFDILPKNINKTVMATEAVKGDVGANLKQLLPLIQPSPRTEWFAQIADWKQRFPFRYEPRATASSPLKPQQVIEELDRQCLHRKEEVIITTGVGQHQMWAAQYYRWRHSRTFITSGGLGTMGFGLPAAIGAKMARPDSIVVDIDGDGSLCMTAMELATAAQYGIGVKVLLLNNDFQGMVKQWQDLFYDKRYSATQMVNPDFVKLAEAMNVKGMRVRTEEELSEKMAEFLAYPGPVLMDCVVEKHEHVFPMVPAGKGLEEMVLSAAPAEPPSRACK